MSFSVDLWPDGVGEFVGLTPSAGAGWQCLDDTSESDYVYVESYNDLNVCSYYSLQNLSLPAKAIIENVRLTARGNRPDSYSSYDGWGKPALKVGSSYYSAPSWTTFSSSALIDFYYDWANNPNTGVPWTQADINGMLVGLYLRCESHGWQPPPQARAYWLRCTVTCRIPGSPRAQIIGLW